MKIRKTTKILLGFAILCVAFIVTAFIVADCRAESAREKAQKAGRSLVEPNTGVFKLIMDEQNVEFEETDSLVVAPNGDTILIKTGVISHNW